MTRWQYRVFQIDHISDPLIHMNGFGNEGWEIFRVQDGLPGMTLLWAKRPQPVDKHPKAVDVSDTDPAVPWPTQWMT